MKSRRARKVLVRFDSIQICLWMWASRTASGHININKTKVSSKCLSHVRSRHKQSPSTDIRRQTSQTPVLMQRVYAARLLAAGQNGAIETRAIGLTHGLKVAVLIVTTPHTVTWIVHFWSNSLISQPLLLVTHRSLPPSHHRHRTSQPRHAVSFVSLLIILPAVVHYVIRIVGTMVANCITVVSMYLTMKMSIFT
mgnify:CR=1 FL=1